MDKWPSQPLRVTVPAKLAEWVRQDAARRGMRPENNVVEHLAAALAGQHRSWPDPPRLTAVKPRRRVRQPPRSLTRGVERVNHLRQTAAEAIIRNTKNRAPGNLAPIQAWRKQRGGGYGFTRTHRGATGVLHEPAWVLRDIDAHCTRALFHWALNTYTNAPPTAAPASPVFGLTIGEAFWIGAVAWEGGHSTTPALLIQHATTLQLSTPMVACLRALAKYPAWQSRIRRCPYDAGRREGCYRYFVDRSPAGTAAACSPAHAVRLIETRGARVPRGPRAPRRRARRSSP